MEDQGQTLKINFPLALRGHNQTYALYYYFDLTTCIGRQPMVISLEEI